MSKKVFVSVLVLLAVSTVFCEWNVNYIQDEMTGAQTWYAVSPLAFPTKQLSFPYQDTTAYLFVFYVNGMDLPVIVFSPSLGLTVGLPYKDGFLYTTRVKWDNKVENIQIFNKLFENGITFIEPAYVIRKIRSSKAMLLELNWIGNGSVYFKFDLTGASKAIDQLHVRSK